MKEKLPSTPKPAGQTTAKRSGWLQQVWLQAIPIVVLVVITIGLYGYRLGNLNGLSPIESQNIAGSQMLGTIAADPLNLPYKLLNFVFLQLPLGPLELKARLASVVIALGCSILFYLILRRWYGQQNALLSTLLFVPSGWLLHTGRFGSGLVMLTLMILALVAMATWLNATDKPDGRLLVIFSLVCATALFVPAGLWFVLAVILVLRTKLTEHIREVSRSQASLVYGILAVAVALIAIAIIRQPGQAMQWLGIPAHLPEMTVIAKHAAGSLAYLVARGPYIPEVWLGHTPLLDAAAIGLFLLGIIFYSKRWQSSRVQLLAVLLLVAAIMVTLNGPYALAYLAPLAYLIAATGLAYLMHQWNSVFPRNPIARGMALIAVSIMLLSAAAFHTQRYFVAWHNSPDTRQAYQADTSAMPPNLIQ